MSPQILAAGLMTAHAHPGGAAHIVLLGIVAVVALAVFGIARLRKRRDLAEAKRHTSSDHHPRSSKRQEHFPPEPTRPTKK